MTLSNSYLTGVKAKTTGANLYRPAVPISVYRELVTELQETQAKFTSLKIENQQLVKQNQQLRQEVAELFRSTHKLQGIVAAFDQETRAKVSVSPVIKQTPKNTTKIPRLPLEKFPYSQNPGQRDDSEQIIEISSPQPSWESGKDGGVNSWWLGMAILAIICTAFGAGFLAVRPLFNSN